MKKSQKIKRVYYHYKMCEEYASMMWKAVDSKERQALIDKSVILLSNADELTKVMCDVVRDWPNSCEATFTASTINHQAWIGAAACAYAHGAPEDVTKQAWRVLSKDQQDLANNAADVVISNWINEYLEKMNA